MFQKSINFLMDHSWGLYLILILTVYGHNFTEASFWVIYIPTMILVALAKVKSRLDGEDSKK